jgi:hypothetical protein
LCPFNQLVTDIFKPIVAANGRRVATPFNDLRITRVLGNEKWLVILNAKIQQGRLMARRYSLTIDNEG